MKKVLLTVILSIITISTLTGCVDMKGIDVNEFTTSTNSNDSTQDEFVDNTLGTYTQTNYATFDFASLGAEYQEFLDVPVDLDLLDLSDIVTFAQVNNMMYMSEDYMGDTVKIHGNYYRHDIEELDLSYHFLMLIDGTNCCTGIMEFKMQEGVDYPESGTNLLLMGEYSNYTDDYGTYPYIIVSDYLTY